MPEQINVTPHLRSPYETMDDLIAANNALPLRGYTVLLDGVASSTALEASLQSLNEQYEVAEASFSTPVDPEIRTRHTILSIIIKGQSADEAAQRLTRVLPPKCGLDNLLLPPIVSIEPIQADPLRAGCEELQQQPRSIQHRFTDMMEMIRANFDTSE